MPDIILSVGGIRIDAKNLNRPGFWYLGSPYSKYPDGIEAAYKRVSRIAALLVSRGVKIFCPITHTHPIAVHGRLDPLDHSIWMPADQPLMDASCGLIVAKMESWQHSVGLSQEIETFKKAGKPIVYAETIGL